MEPPVVAVALEGALSDGGGASAIGAALTTVVPDAAVEVESSDSRFGVASLRHPAMSRAAPAANAVSTRPRRTDPPVSIMCTSPRGGVEHTRSGQVEALVNSIRQVL
jgi:hypothetical protein